MVDLFRIAFGLIAGLCLLALAASCLSPRLWSKWTDSAESGKLRLLVTPLRGFVDISRGNDESAFRRYGLGLTSAAIGAAMIFLAIYTAAVQLGAVK